MNNNNVKLLAVAASALAMVACQGMSSNASTPRQHLSRVAHVERPFTCPAQWLRSEPRPPECPEMPLRAA